MSDQPKPVGYFGPAFDAELKPKPTGQRLAVASEWTGLSLSRLIKEKGYKGAANAHNSALADAYKRGADFARKCCADEENEDLLRLEKQLAAAQAAIQEHNSAVAFPECRRDIPLNDTAALDAAIAAELAAERKKVEQELHDLTCYLEGNCYSDPDFIKDSPALKAAKQLREQLAAAQQPLVDALIGLCKDWHHLSMRPCSTCDRITKLTGQPFGCYWYQEKHKNNPALAQAKEGK